MPITHTTTATGADDPTKEINAAQWNAAHTNPDITDVTGLSSALSSGLSRSNHTGTQLASTISDFASTVLSTVLSGFSTASSAVATASDTVLSALGKLQAQVSLRAPIASPTFTGTVGGITAAMVGAPSGSGTSTGSNTGDQTSIVGITGTKAQFDTACTDGNFLYAGDVTQYTDEMAQDAVGAMVNSTLTYNDAAPSLGVANNTSTQKIEVTKNSGAVVGTRKQLNFIEGSNVTLTVADDSGNDQVDITIAASGGGGSIIRPLGATFDGNINTVESGYTVYVAAPFGGTITAYNIIVDTGTCTIKTWRKAAGTAIPTVSDSISTSGVSISSGTVIRSTTLTDFTSTTITANDILAFNITAVSGATKIVFILEVTS